MKTIRRLLLVVAILISVMNASGKPKVKNTGYLVATITETDGLQIIETTELVDVYAAAEIYFPNNSIDFSKELNQSVYFIIKSQHRSFFVELKKINRRGKYCRMSEREYKQLKKTIN